MTENIYHTLRDVLDTIPNGFPATESGVEIKILKKIFTEEEAALTAQLKLKWETPDQIAERTGLDIDYLKKMLPIMDQKGQLMSINLGAMSVYRLMPFVFGIYEFQLKRIDRELAELFEEYAMTAFGKDFFDRSPALMKVVPIESEIDASSSIEPYESVTKLIERAKSFMVNECICKTERALMGHPCSKPTEVCLGFAPIENYFDDGTHGRPISKEEALDILKKSEEAGLVHMTSNTKKGHFYICNCCSCCCGPLIATNLISTKATAKSNYLAAVDAESCTACGLCIDRCQVNAITVDDVAVINDRCIGCGLCATTCPAASITMKRRDESDIPPVPRNELDWMAQRAAARGQNDDYKKLL